MNPQLWTRDLEWPEWRQMHPDLDDREAEYLYQVEQRMFQNYRDEIINQTLIRQAKLSGDLMNLSADISTILGQGSAAPRKAFDGLIGNISSAYGVFIGSDYYQFKQGDRFIVDFLGPIINGTYKVLTDYNQQQNSSVSLALLQVQSGINAGYWELE